MPGLSPTIDYATPSARILAIVPGFREWVLVALVVVALYGRTAQVRPGRFFVFRRPGRGQNHSLALNWLVAHWWSVFVTLTGLGVLAWLATSFRIMKQSVSP